MSPVVRLTAALLSAVVVVAGAAPASAADRAAYLAACEKERGAEAKAMCTCVADKVDAAFKDKQLVFAYESLAKPIGEFVDVDLGLTEQEEDDVVDKTYAIMKDCGLVK